MTPYGKQKQLSRRKAKEGGFSAYFFLSENIGKWPFVEPDVGQIRNKVQFILFFFYFSLYFFIFSSTVLEQADLFLLLSKPKNQE